MTRKMHFLLWSLLEKVSYMCINLVKFWCVMKFQCVKGTYFVWKLMRERVRFNYYDDWFLQVVLWIQNFLFIDISDPHFLFCLHVKNVFWKCVNVINTLVVYESRIFFIWLTCKYDYKTLRWYAQMQLTWAFLFGVTGMASPFIDSFLISFFFFFHTQTNKFTSSSSLCI